MPQFEPKSVVKRVALATAPFAVLVLAVLYGIITSHVHAPPASLAPFALESRPVLAPVVAFSDGAGKRHSLGDFRGHYVLVNVWATWCGPCVKELPSLARLKQAVPSLGVLVVNWGQDASAASAFLSDHKVRALGTSIDPDGALVRAFHGYGLPLTVLIDPQGKVIAKAEGAAHWSAPASVAYFKALTAGS